MLLLHIRFSLEPIPPFRLDLTVWALRRRPDNAVDRWDGRTYRRTVALTGEPVEIAVTQAGPPEEARLQVKAIGYRLPAGARPTTKRRWPGCSRCEAWGAGPLNMYFCGD